MPRSSPPQAAAHGGLKGLALRRGERRLGGEGQAEDENAEVIGVDPIKLGEGQGAGALAHLDGIAGAIVGLDEPILVARVAAEGGLIN